MSRAARPTRLATLSVALTLGAALGATSMANGCLTPTDCIMFNSLGYDWCADAEAR